ncbi:MAG: HAD family hydrolase [Deltaproteobacteria bacterium]|nr:HAD family hydrolase [Deltaproteobacteria bacterium]
MNIQAILFDVNGTLIDIQTDEGNEEIYRGISHFLTYQGMYVHRWDVRDEYFRLMDEQRGASAEAFPEFDAVELWREFLRRRPEASHALPPDKLRWMPLFLAEMYRGVSRFRLQLYPDVKNVLDELLRRFKLAALSDAQSVWALPEMRAVGIETYFQPIIVSGDFAFRKPDKRIFEAALSGLDLPPENVIFVGNDMYRDVYGAKQFGMKTVFFSSNQGRKTANGVEPDYIIYQFAELRQAIAFFDAQ